MNEKNKELTIKTANWLLQNIFTIALIIVVLWAQYHGHFIADTTTIVEVCSKNQSIWVNGFEINQTQITDLGIQWD